MDREILLGQVTSSYQVVAHAGFEPAISSLRGRCPKPLDECAFGRLYNQRLVSAITFSKEKGSPIGQRALTSRCR